MSIDTPFGSEDLMDMRDFDCESCEDQGVIEWGTRMVPCPSCRSAEHDYAVDVGGVEP